MVTKKRGVVIADLTIFPVGEGTSVGDFVNKAFESMSKVKGVKLQPTSMSTIVETDDLHKVISTLERAHETMLGMGAKRVYIVMKVDHRLDKPHSGQYKIDRMTRKIQD